MRQPGVGHISSNETQFAKLIESWKERKDLIEDLNEDGISDPKHPSQDDLPLIVSRLELIDELAPYALDKVNADAFAEARKDLVNMLDGKPVQ